MIFGMANEDDEALETGADGSSWLPTGARRSTFTPPTVSMPTVSTEPDIPESRGDFDDDALASALAEEMSKLGQTGAISAVAPSTGPVPESSSPSASELSNLPAPSGPPVVFPDAPAGEPFPTGPTAAAPSTEPAATEFVPSAPAFIAEPPVVSATNPALSAPSPAAALDPLTGLPQAPRRQSLDDAELVRTIDDKSEAPGGTLDAIGKLEAQLALRQQEARDFDNWQQTMLAIGTPEALSSLEQARPAFTGVISVIPTPDRPATESADAAPPVPPSPPVDAPRRRSSFAPPTAPTVVSAPPAPAPIDTAAESPAEPVDRPQDEADPLPPVPPASQPADQAGSFDSLIGDGLDGATVPPKEQTPFPRSPFEAGFWTSVAPAADPVPTPPEPEPLAEPEQLAVPEQAEEPEEPEQLIEPEPRSGGELAPATIYNFDELLAGAGAAVEPPVAEPLPFVVALPPTVAPSVVDPVPVDDSTASEVRGAQQPDDANDDASDDDADADADANDADANADADDGAHIAGDTAGGAAPIFIEPIGLLDPDRPALQTGSQAVVVPSYEAEPEDSVDETDRAFEDEWGTTPVAEEDEALQTEPTSSAPIQPLLSPRVPADEIVLSDDVPVVSPPFAVELSGPEPTPLDRRVGRAARLFWLWFATNSSVLSIAFGGALFSLGMSLRQAIVAAFVGVAISFLPLGLGTLAGKWSGQPTMIASRATFGVVGNVVPAAVAVIARVFWGAVLLWLIAISTAHILVGADVNGALGEAQLTVLIMALGFIVALAIAVFGYSLFARIQLVLTIVSAVLVIGIVVVTWPSVDVSAALTVGDGPWILVVTGVVLVFSFIGLVWVNSSGDLARYQRPSSSGAAAMLWAPFGATLPAFVLIAYGALLAASSPTISHGLAQDPLNTIAHMIPAWYPAPLIAATVLSLLSGVILSIYSGGFAVQAIGLRAPRAWSSALVGVLVFAVAILLSVSVVSVVPVFRDFATTIAVPVAAWAGIFTAEMIVRRRRFDSESLLRRGGVYPDVNWVNLAMLVLASAIGFGLTTATVTWLTWQGYLFSIFGVKLTSDLAGTDVGVLVALVFGLLITFITGVPNVRRQERSTASLV
jgi:purine-cytosine permease-like protein